MVSFGAPEELEPVRMLLNSWSIPKGSRLATDKFDSLAQQHHWSRREARLVRQLRDDLRCVVERGHLAKGHFTEVPDECLNTWIARLGFRVAVANGKLSYPHDGGPAGEFLAAVIGAIAAGTWARLKACPNCRWVFYDHTRNGSKRWCVMYAGGPDVRACGTIAKVRRYRNKQAAASAGAG
jgi:hypothetical protein